MPLHYILDGYNIIKNSSFKRIKKLKDQRVALLMMLKEKKSYLGKKSKITVVFDGKKDNFDISYRKDEDIEIVFTHNESADDWIKDKVKSLKDVKDTVVVSDDKEIIFFVKSYVKSYMGVEEFMEKFSPSKAKPDDFIKPELSYKEILEINEELKRIWIKE
jgi:predicted RNA-binding protein with PIN domain